MTRRAGRSASNDTGLADLLHANTPSVCLVGKAWDWQVETALKISKKENLKMIEESFAHVRGKKREGVFDAEHFFDGYKANPDYCALDVLRAAIAGGASWLVLCDTNGGSLPSEIYRIVGAVKKALPKAHLAFIAITIPSRRWPIRSQRSRPGCGRCKAPSMVSGSAVAMQT